MIVQGTPEWLALRVGKVTASCVSKVIARTKTGWGAERANYMAELVTERLTGASSPAFVNDAMRWGTDQEPNARRAYMERFGVEVVETSFVDHPEVTMSGASPDGLVGLDGLVEIKCPNTATHLDTLLGGGIADKYLVQMQWQMACTGRDWCDFVSFDPRLPGPMQMHVERVPRDASRILSLESEVAAFIAELDGKVETLRQRYMLAEAA